MQGVQIDESGSILRVVYGEDYTEDDIHAVFAAQLRMIERGVPFAMLHDASSGRALSIRERQIGADHIKKYTAEYRRYCVGSAVVIRSAINRGVVTALSWIIKFPYPMHSFADSREAMAWLTSRLQSDVFQAST